MTCNSCFSFNICLYKVEQIISLSRFVHCYKERIGTQFFLHHSFVWFQGNDNWENGGKNTPLPSPQYVHSNAAEDTILQELEERKMIDRLENWKCVECIDCYCYGNISVIRWDLFLIFANTVFKYLVI